MDYKKIVAHSQVYEVKNDLMNQIQREDIDNVAKQLNVSNNPDRIAKELGAAIFLRKIFLHIHPALIDQYINMPGFVITRVYPKRSYAINNEIGFVGSFRVIIDSSLEDYVIDGPNRDKGDCMEDIYISIAQMGNGDGRFDSKNYIIIKSC